MANPNKAITKNQAKYIADNHRRMSIREMATNLKTTYSIIYGYMARNEIPVRVVRTKKLIDRGVRQPDAEAPEGYFNPSQQSNWLF